MNIEDKIIKDKQSVLPGGSLIRELIDGVKIKEMPNIVTRNGTTSEVFRNDWDLTPYQIVHMIHVSQRAGGLSAWHYHKLQTDHIFVNRGIMKLVLYDPREGSPTEGAINEFHLSVMQPTLCIIPPLVVHGIKNLDSEDSCFINFFNREYQYDDPDEYRLPSDSPHVPYQF